MNDWPKTKNGLVKNYQFKDFLKAIDFVNNVAKIAEAENHHPDILVHSYNQVKLTLITHDKKQVTSKDYILAEKIDNLLHLF